MLKIKDFVSTKLEFEGLIRKNSSHTINIREEGLQETSKFITEFFLENFPLLNNETNNRIKMSIEIVEGEK